MSNLVVFTSNLETAKALQDRGKLVMGDTFVKGDESLSRFTDLTSWIVERAQRQGGAVHVISWLPERWILPMLKLTQRLGVVLDEGDGRWTLIQRAAIRQTQLPAWARDTQVPFTGNPAPRVLIVGDQLSSRAIGPWPFHLPTGSSAWLHFALGRRDDVALLNAYDLASSNAFQLLLQEPIKTGVPKRIICLGKASAKALRHSTGLEPEVVLAHPSWARRFHSKELAGYAATVQAACDGRDTGRLWTLS